MAICSSCGRSTKSYVELPCPGKGCKAVLTRCSECKANQVSYACEACGFSGP